jgi:hypothetical protein
MLGLYDYPRYDEELGGILAPDVDQVAKAIARKNGWRIQPSGAVAANQLGLSTQVPAQVVYLSSGQSKTYKVGSVNLRFKRAAPRELVPGTDIGALVTQALRHLGKASVDDDVIESLRRKLPPKSRKRLLGDAKSQESWIWESIQRIAAEDGD